MAESSLRSRAARAALKKAQPRIARRKALRMAMVDQAFQLAAASGVVVH
jgi:hypothetical protein